MEEEVSKPQDPRDMRKRITEVAYRGGRMDGNSLHLYQFSAAAAMARTCMHAAAAAGYSGEDAMTMLAYHALLSLEQANDRIFEFVSTRPTPPIFVVSETAAHENNAIANQQVARQAAED